MDALRGADFGGHGRFRRRRHPLGPNAKTGCCPALGNNLILSAKTLPDDGLFLLKFLVFFTESFDAAGRIHQLLLTRKKRMALGADFDSDSLFGGSHLESGPTGTLDAGVVVFRMDFWFHNDLNPLKRH
jgi:hypothetical protein